MFHIKGLPIGWALCPPFVSSWLSKVITKGVHKGRLVIFQREAVLRQLRNDLQVPQVADFLQKYLPEGEVAFFRSQCSEVVNNL